MGITELPIRITGVSATFGGTGIGIGTQEALVHHVHALHHASRCDELPRVAGRPVEPVAANPRSGRSGFRVPCAPARSLLPCHQPTRWLSLIGLYAPDAKTLLRSVDPHSADRDIVQTRGQFGHVGRWQCENYQRPIEDYRRRHSAYFHEIHRLSRYQKGGTDVLL